MSTPRSFKPAIKLPITESKAVLKRRAAFATLTKPEQRVAIARDAIKQLTETKRFRAQTGRFIEVDDSQTIKGTDRLSATIKRATRRKPCTVCALGALLASQALVNGDCQLRRLTSNGDSGRISPMVKGTYRFHPFMLAYFEPDQLRLIEIAFEMGYGAFRSVYTVNYAPHAWKAVAASWGSDLTLGETKRAIAFGDRYSAENQDRARLLAILRNVVRNGGTFVP